MERRKSRKIKLGNTTLGGDSPDENTYENNTQQFVEVEQPEEVN